MTEGIKYDKDKPELADFLLDFKEPLMELYKVWSFGKEKYGKSNWKEVKDGYRRCQNALIRHFFEEGSNTDAETDIHHAAHMAFNCLAMIKFILDERECPTTNENDVAHKNIPDDGKTLNDEPASGQLVKVRNKKTGKFYNAWIGPDNTIINTTNAQDGESMILYFDPNTELFFIREEKEFREKFEIV